MDTIAKGTSKHKRRKRKDWRSSKGIDRSGRLENLEGKPKCSLACSDLVSASTTRPYETLQSKASLSSLHIQKLKPCQIPLLWSLRRLQWPSKTSKGETFPVTTDLPKHSIKAGFFTSFSHPFHPLWLNGKWNVTKSQR